MNNGILNKDDTLKDIYIKMSEGIVGALSVLLQIVKEGEDGLLYVLALDSLGIRGSRLWVLYKNCCGQDLDLFKIVILNTNQESLDEMIESRKELPPVHVVDAYLAHVKPS